MSFFRINNTIVNTAHVARVTRDKFPDDPDTVTVWMSNGHFQAFDSDEAQAVWDYFKYDTVDLNEAIELTNKRAARFQAEAARHSSEHVPY